MLVPLLLLIPAAIAIAIVAYGIHPAWAQYPHGIELIVFARRLQWPLLALAIVLCVILLGLVIGGRRRAWWLVGLAPILALLAHRFALDPDNAFAVNSMPIFVSAEQADFVNEDDWVVGLVDDGDALAYPYASLYARPLVIQSDQAKPMVLMWSPFANCARASRVDRSIRAGEIELVSMPANALLVYNSRLGQFINGITLRTVPNHQKPEGFGAEIPTIKTTWRQWRTLHPGTRVLAPGSNSGHSPRQPVMPFYPMPKYRGPVPAQTPVALVGGDDPLAILDSDVGQQPVNFSQPLAVFVREPLTGEVEGFERKIDNDLFPMFAGRTWAKIPKAVMVDADSGSAWTSDGRAIDGPMKGRKLDPISIEDGVYYGVMSFWYPSLAIEKPLPAPSIADQGQDPNHPRQPRHRRKKPETAQ